MDIYTLDKSNGSQTAIVPKSTYKEIETQSHLAKITAILYLHNKFKLLKVFIKIPDDYKDYPLGWLQRRDDYKWANHLPLPKLIGNWKPKKTNRVEDGWDTYDIKDDEYYYCIENIKIIKNKKYKAPPVKENSPPEDNTRIRRRRIHRIVLLRQETELNAKLEELQKQENDLTIQYEKAQTQRTISKQKLEEAERELEEAENIIYEVNKKSLDIKTKQNEVKEEIKKNKIEIAKKNNKNGYVILAHDDYEGKEQVYGYSKTLEEAQTIAKEAVEMGTRRLEKRVAIETDFVVGAKIEALWTKDNKWYEATIAKVHGDKSQAGKKYINKYDVKWKDGGLMSWGLELHQIRNVTDYNKFNSARIVDLDTQIEVEEYGLYTSDGCFGYP
jgi:hypothetical protein